jgi:hypothetical protein
MVSLSSFTKEYKIPKSSAHSKLQDAGYDTSNGLSPEAQRFLAVEYGIDLDAAADVEVVVDDDAPAGEITISAWGQDIEFNGAEIVGLTNGTCAHITAINQIGSVASQLRQGIERIRQQAQTEYLEVSAAARDQEAELDELNHAITQARAESTVLEAIKQDRLNQALDAKARLENLRKKK